MDKKPVRLRIGEVSRRVGVSSHLLRAWERRYGVLHPVRSESGYRLYTELDEERVRAMKSYLARGLSASEAALAALAAYPVPDDITALSETTGPHHLPQSGRESLPKTRERLARALDRFDEPAAETLLDALFAGFTLETALRSVLLPYLCELGERWENGRIAIAQEHFASNVIRSRLAGLCRGWARGGGPQALLACAPGELHDLPLLAFGVVLYRNGWRIRFLGSGLPLADVIRTAVETPPRITVLSAVDVQRFAGTEGDLRRLAQAAPLAIGGRGATPEIARAGHAQLLAGNLVTEAERLSASVAGHKVAGA